MTKGGALSLSVILVFLALGTTVNLDTLTIILSILFLLAPIIILSLLLYRYRAKLSLWYSAFFYQGLFILGVIVYLGAVAPSWPVFFQNLSLIPLSTRLVASVLLSVTLTIPFLICFRLKKRTAGDYFLKKAITHLSIVVLFNFCLDAYYILQLLSVSNTPKLAKHFVFARYGAHQNIRNGLSKTKLLKEPDSYGSPNRRIRLTLKNGAFDLVDTKNNSQILSMSHWVISPDEVFWLVNDNGQAEYSLYRWAYDNKDCNKIYLTDLKSKKTVLLAKGTWLYDDHD